MPAYGYDRELFLKRRDDFHVMGITKLIDRRDMVDRVAAIDQRSCVTREGGCIAGHSDHERHRAFNKLSGLCLGALTRRVEHDGIENIEFACHEWTPEKV